MKNKLLILFIFVFFVACGTTSTNDNTATEVGNPTSPSPTEVPSAAIASALTKSIESSFSELPSATVDNYTNDELRFASEATDDFVCTYDHTTMIETCTCPEGGTLTHTFSAETTREKLVYTFDTNMDTVYDSCVIETCETTVTLDGDANGNLSGTYTLLTQDIDFIIENGTTEDCSGIDANSYDVGFGFDMTITNDTVTFEGSFCVDDKAVTFTSLDDLQSQVDPDDSCEDF